ncbi:MAG: heme-copper oxidase subunit III [Planctomycetota bacterium]
MSRRADNADWGPLDSRESVPGAGLFAMRLMLASLSMPFFAIIICYLKMRSEAHGWLPAPALLWQSTSLIIGLSVCAQLSLWLIRAHRDGAAKIAATITLLLGVAFLVSQLFVWTEIQHQFAADSETLRPYREAFRIVAGLHALHVIGGVLVQVVVIFQAVRLPYWAHFHPGLHYSAMYWHFLGVTWLALFAMLLASG